MYLLFSTNVLGSLLQIDVCLIFEFDFDSFSLLVLIEVCFVFAFPLSFLFELLFPVGDSG